MEADSSHRLSWLVYFPQLVYGRLCSFLVTSVDRMTGWDECHEPRNLLIRAFTENALVWLCEDNMLPAGQFGWTDMCSLMESKQLPPPAAAKLSTTAKGSGPFVSPPESLMMRFPKGTTVLKAHSALCCPGATVQWHESWLLGFLTPRKVMFIYSFGPGD